jgi:hypothetical protein
MLYAVTNDEMEALRKQNEEDMYGYMLDHIEEAYISTPRACDLNKAWEGIHFCLNDGEWIEDDSTKSKVIFSGEMLLDYNDHVITLKNKADIDNIVAYLNSINLEELITENFQKIPAEEYTLPMDANGLDFVLGWSEEIKSFYEYAQKEGFCVIFTVDL